MEKERERERKRKRKREYIWQMIVDEGENDDEEKSNAIHHCRTTETTHYHKRALRVNSQSR